MAYNKTTWINGVTVADENNMNNIENGIEGLDLQVNKNWAQNDVDANDFTESGFYYLGTGCQHVPDAYIKLIVSGGHDVAQLGIQVNADDPKIYIRTFDGTNWSPWRRVSGTNISELSNSQSKFTNIQVNEVVRSGNVVTVDFRGYINENIADSSEFLRLPYAPRDAGTAIAYLGTNYTVSAPVWFYWTTHVKELRGNSMNAGNWLHMHFTYITDDI